jgi:hypothetical protein
MESSAFNPYAAPEEQVLPDSLSASDPEVVRRQFIHCESNIKSIGGLMVFGGLLMSCGFALATVDAFSGSNGDFWRSLRGLFFLGVILAGIWQIYTGIQLRRLKRASRVPAAIACGLWILFVPVGTILGGVSLWYILRPAANFVFSEEYGEAVQRTPQVTTSTSIAGWSVLLVILLIGGLLLLAGILLD